MENNTISPEITQSEKLHSFLTENGFELVTDDHTVTLVHGNKMVALFGPGGTAREIYGAAAEYLGKQIDAKEERK